MLLLEARLPHRTFQSVHATAVVKLPKNRRRDEGNYRAELEKALGDVLVERQWLPDDTAEHFTFGAVTFDRGKAGTVITMEVQG